jgi:hypothetical protein
LSGDKVNPFDLLPKTQLRAPEIRTVIDKTVQESALLARDLAVLVQNSFGSAQKLFRISAFAFENFV